MEGKSHLVDTLLKRDIPLCVFFHLNTSFRGSAMREKKRETTLIKKTHIEVVSLYGKHTKPTPQDLEGVGDAMCVTIPFVRFYTYISSFQLYMETCLENSIPVRSDGGNSMDFM